MEVIKRAFLYVTRKKGKSILLFLILLVMATFVLTGLSIDKASQLTQKNLRKTMGGEFQIAIDLSESNPYFKKNNDGEGNVEVYTELPITQDIIDAILKINGIEGYDASTQTLVSTNLDIFSGNVPLKEVLNDKVYARTVASTENNSLFQTSTMELIEGSHITRNESDVAVISKDLADKNSLKLGDFISLQADKVADVKIIGIYEILKPDSPYTNIVTYEKIENQIFIDTHTLQNLFGDVPVGFDSVSFTVDDPAQLDNITSEVKELSSIDWRAFTVVTDNKTYLDAAAPLHELQTLVTSMILVIALVSAIILSLILTMWGRSRIHETGVFLSLGISKMKIIGQYLTEILMIAIFAFGFSYFTSSAVANRLANELLQQNVTANEEQMNDITVTRKEGYSDDVVVTVKKDSDPSDMSLQQENGAEIKVATTEREVAGEQINVTIELYNMLQLYFIGFAIITISVGISSLSVMCLKPREILSKMS